MNAVHINDMLIVLLADGPTKTGPDFGKASPVGLLVVVLLLISVFVLVWSMNRHLKKVRDNFAGAEDTPAVAESTATAEGGGTAPSREPSSESGG